MKEMKMYQQHPHCEEKEGAHLYKIGMFANMNRVTIKTLRYYDDQKLLTPVYVKNRSIALPIIWNRDIRKKTY